MPINYLFLDDLSDEELKPYIDRVERVSAELKINHIRPGSFESTIGQLRKIKDGDGADFADGYILDLRLDEQKIEGEARATYVGQTVAQQLRALMARGQLPSVPIVVWSIDKRIETYYSPTTRLAIFLTRCMARTTKSLESPPGSPSK